MIYFCVIGNYQIKVHNKMQPLATLTYSQILFKLYSNTQYKDQLCIKMLLFCYFSLSIFFFSLLQFSALKGCVQLLFLLCFVHMFLNSPVYHLMWARFLFSFAWHLFAILNLFFTLTQQTKKKEEKVMSSWKGNHYSRGNWEKWCCGTLLKTRCRY